MEKIFLFKKYKCNKTNECIYIKSIDFKTNEIKDSKDVIYSSPDDFLCRNTLNDCVPYFYNW